MDGEKALIARAGMKCLLLYWLQKYSNYGKQPNKGIKNRLILFSILICY